MKTLTEFTVAQLKLATKTVQELTAAGKSPEELPTALGEALKLEGDKLNFLRTALGIIGTRLTDLKRVVVFTLTENEKAPHGAVQQESNYFLPEFYPSLDKPTRPSNDDHRSDNGKRRGKGGAGGKGQRGRPQNQNDGRPTQNRDAKPDGQRPRSDRPQQTRPLATPSTNPQAQIIIKSAAKPKITPRIQPLNPTSAPTPLAPVEAEAAKAE